MKQTTPAPRSRQTLLVPGCFEQVCKRSRRGKLLPEEVPAFDCLIEDAEACLLQNTESLLGKQHVPPSGDKRDYFSLSVYFWPNPETADGLPYVPRDGEVNPEIQEYDRPRFFKMARTVDTLSLAYAMTGDERFAARAAEWLRVWFVEPETRMNPNMLFAQYIPGDDVVLPWKKYPARFVPGTGGRKGVFVSFGGVIEDLDLAPLTDGIRILRGSEHWSDSDDAAVVSWYHEYTEWLLTHQHGKDEASAQNNHGSWYWAEVVCFLHFAGQSERAGRFAEEVLPQRLKLQIEPDGSQPEELVRTLAMSYSAFTLASFSNLALAAEACGSKLWTVKTDDGRSFQNGVDWILPYLTGEKTWEWKQIKPFVCEEVIGILYALHHGTGDEKYLQAIKRLPGVPVESRYHLLYPVSNVGP